MFRYSVTLIHRDGSDHQISKKEFIIETPEGNELDEISPIMISKRVNDATVEAIKLYLDTHSIYEGDSLIIHNVERVHGQ